MSKKACLKGTAFACPCDRCMEEYHQKAMAHLVRLKGSIAGYWTNQYSARDKADTVVIQQAGFDHQPGCECLFCQVERERKGDER
jgi:hypothetical protein